MNSAQCLAIIAAIIREAGGGVSMWQAVKLANDYLDTAYLFLLPTRESHD